MLAVKHSSLVTSNTSLFAWNKPLRIVILGYGVRGRTYAKYALSHPLEFEIVAVADPIFKGSDQRTGGNPPLPQSIQTFCDWRDALSAEADAAIIALPDLLHCAAAEEALNRGFHILLEKPIGCSLEECERVKQAQRRTGLLVLAGYVLRFSAYYRQLKQVLRSHAIGDIVSIHHLVAIGYGKAAHAFCRGNWGREADGTTALVQKCSHDFDLIVWWTGKRMPQRIASFGSLMHWRPENAPRGAAMRCVECPASVREACPFDAVRLYCGEKDLRYHFSDESDEAMRSVVENSQYGRCVYHCGNDAVDHQTAIMEYSDGLTVTLEMEAYSKLRRRCTHFYGTRGVIECDGEDVIRINPFLGEDTVIHVTSEQAKAHHGGGDREIMTEFYRLATTASSERFAAILDAELESHMLAFAAEASRMSR